MSTDNRQSAIGNRQSAIGGPRLAGPASSPWPGWAAAFAVAFALYASTANRGAQWQDPGLHILRVVTGELQHPLGLALAHPLHHWLGRFVVSLNILEPCFAITLISALAGAVTVANTYGCLFTLTRNRMAAALACASLGLAHTVWQMSTLAEIYTLTGALLSAECWCVVAFVGTRRGPYIVLAFAFNGLGVANHVLALLTTPVLVAAAIWGLRSRALRGGDVLLAAGAWVCGSLPYTCLVGLEAIRTGEWAATLHSAFFGKTYANRVLNLTLSWRMLLLCAACLALSFPNLLVPMAGYGILRGMRPGTPAAARNYLLAALLIHFLFVARFSVVDQYRFFLPVCTLLAICGGVGFAGAIQLWGGPGRRRLLVGGVVAVGLTPVWYALAPPVARRYHVLDSVARNKPYRDDYVYVFTPWSVVEQSADIMSRRAVELAGKKGLIIVEDSMAEPAVRYLALRAGLEQSSVIGDPAAQAVASAAQEGRTVVLVPRRVDRRPAPPPIGVWAREGDLYVLAKPSPGIE